MKAITGLKPYTIGDVEYMGASIKGVPPYLLLRRGLAMVPEGRAIFARMSIVENMQTRKANVHASREQAWLVFQVFGFE